MKTSPLRSMRADERRRAGTRSWLQRLGVAGFLFFLIKGLLWLAVPGLLAYLGYR
jgi:DMSO reductase anchor subunit